MFRKLIVSVAVVTAMLIAFAYLNGISKMDVSIKHQMQRHVVAEPFEAGDIVKISGDGLRIESLLCRSNLSEDKRASSSIDAVYYNIVDHSQAKFFEYVDVVKSTVGLGASDTPQVSEPWRLHFVGEVNRVVGEMDTILDNECTCAVAKAVIEQRAKACVVTKSLVETKLDQDAEGRTVIRATMGVSFRDDAIFFYDPKALKGICPNLNTEAIAPPPQSCSGTSGFAFDVMAKAKIGLIRQMQ
ncbi:hypothetical protein RXV86_01895 [Alisedimentitalea sp. MJ-SS2]|uniref:hypothetical protein n=1 Tax=Aliisedimentitalea sp. MJ-SS2 TaxID=3049795 RepID=UPI00291175C6|nr:hypothetical protein [Alisedimentitalea sp. MJ-SS2]MDU8926128.1 hypothetical protein [Alisedimentitalea sp. MJ-SS2]